MDEILKYTSIPVIARPNAGLPIYKDGKTTYDIMPEEFSKEIVKMANKEFQYLEVVVVQTRLYKSYFKKI